MKSYLALTFLGLCGALIGCGGSGGGTTTTGNTGTTGTPYKPVSYEMPVTANFDYNTSVVVDINDKMQMCGAIPGSHILTAAYWATPIAQPIPMNPPGNYYSSNITNALNNKGEIVGQADTNAKNQEALYWSSPTANVVILKQLANSTSCAADSINDSGAIVGYATINSVDTAIYWANSTTTPQVLTGGSKIYPRISNTGTIVATNYLGGANTSVIWTSPTATPITLQGTAFVVNAHGVAVGASSKGATVWTPPSYKPEVLAMPSGYSSSIALGINDFGEIVGYLYGTGSPQTNASYACMWTSPTAPCEVLNSYIPASTGWLLGNGDYVLNNGIVMGYGAVKSSTFPNSAIFLLTPKGTK